MVCSSCVLVGLMVTVVCLADVATPVRAQSVGLEGRPILAVVDLEGEALGADGRRVVTDAVWRVAFASDKYDLVSVGEVTAYLSGSGLSRCSDEQCLASVGKALAADIVLGGSVSKIGAKWVATLRVVDTSTARLLNLESGSFVGGVEDLDVKVSDVAGAVLGVQSSEEALLTSVYVTSEPAGASVFVDEEFWGTTPLDTAVPEGKHKIRVEMRGYSAWEQAFSIRSGQRLPVVVRMTPFSDSVIETEWDRAKRKGTSKGSWIMFGLTYVGTIVGDAALADGDMDQEALIPFAGPFILIDVADEPIEKGLAGFAGVLQVYFLGKALLSGTSDRDSESVAWKSVRHPVSLDVDGRSLQLSCDLLALVGRSPER